MKAPYRSEKMSAGHSSYRALKQSIRLNSARLVRALYVLGGFLKRRLSYVLVLLSSFLER